MRKILITAMAATMLFNMSGMAVYAIQDVPQQRTLQAAPNARSIEFAFVFDGKSDKNAETLKTFQQTITKSLLPDYKAVFPQDLIFVGDWSENGAIEVSKKALNSRATTVISLGYMSSMYLADLKNPKKFVVTVGEYGLRDMGSAAFYNPIKQYVNDFILFKKLVKDQHKTAVLMNENFYKTQKDWNAIVNKKLKEKDCDLEVAIIPVSEKNYSTVINKLPSNINTVFVTPLYNLSTEQRKELYKNINAKKLPSFSSLGQEDVELGALMGTSTPDADRKLAESTSFNIHGYLHGNAVKNEKLPFYDDKVIFYNKDTGNDIGYSAPLRLLNNCEIISHAAIPTYDLSYVFNTLEERNLTIAQKKFLVDAARRSTVSAYLKYLPTLRMDLGYQTYNSAYANSYSNVPTRVGQFTVAMDQMLFAPDLVTNILVKHKKLKFEKAEKVLTEQSIGLQTGYLYLDVLMFENMIKVQEESLKESRENLAIAKTRQQAGLCGMEEVLQWAGKVSTEEKKLINMKVDYNNTKITVNKLLYKDQTEDYRFAPLTANDPAFVSSDIHIVDHVRTPEKLAKFTDMLVEEVIYLSPETTKLKAAIAMKKAEMANYAQKFVLPNAMMSLEYGTQFDRHLPYESAGNNQLKSGQAAAYSILTGTGAAGYMGAFANSPYLNLNKTSGRFLIAAQWKPIEGGQKFAEIARCKAELNQLNAYLEQVNTELEMTIREVINRAIGKFFMIEKSYKAMFAEGESYQNTKVKYMKGDVSIAQVMEVQDSYLKSKSDALNSQYEFFKELMWVQRGLVSVNWSKASKEAKDWIQHIPEVLPAEPDFSL